MSVKGWIRIGTHEGQPLYFHTEDHSYAVDDDDGMRNVSKEELIMKSIQRRSATRQDADV